MTPSDLAWLVIGFMGFLTFAAWLVETWPAEDPMGERWERRL